MTKLFYSSNRSWISPSATQAGLDPWSFFRDPAKLKAELKTRFSKAPARPRAYKLLEKNLRELKAGEKTLANFELLKNGKGWVVVAGQQPCLLGGPLLVLHKAAQLVAICRFLKEHYQLPLIPVFWNASEDHDLGEMLHWVELGLSGSLSRYRLEAYLSRLGAESLEWGAELDELIQKKLPSILAKQLSGTRYGGHFSQILLKLFEDDGLLLVEPRDFRDESENFWQEVEKKSDRLISDLDKDEKDLLNKGVILQAPRRTPLPLFALSPSSGTRTALHKTPAGWLRDEEKKQSQKARSLFAALKGDEVLSAGALLRPALASFVLPLAVSLLGPAEWLYHQQNISLFGELGLDRPLLWPRISATAVPEGLHYPLLELEKSSFEKEKDALRKTFLAWLKKGGQQDILSSEEKQKTEKNFAPSFTHLEKKMEQLLRESEYHLVRQRQLKSELTPQKRAYLNNLFYPESRDQERVLGAFSLLKSPRDWEQLVEVFKNPLDFRPRSYSVGGD